jgi:hypothetical protein
MLQQVQLNPNVRGKINCVIGTGVHQAKVLINLDSRQIIFVGVPKVFKCGNCGFMHPDNRAINIHCDAIHRHMPVSIIGGLPPEIAIDDLDTLIIQ